MPNVFSLLLALALLLPMFPLHAETEALPRTFTCGPLYRKPGFPTVEAFLETVRSREEPWNELLMPDGMSEGDELAKLSAPLAENVSILHRDGGSALVYAENAPFRGAPFVAVIFHLSSTRGIYHVEDFIHRSAEIGSEAGIEAPKILKLAPERYVHFAFTEFEGGRRWNFAHYRLFIVRNHRFENTLSIENGGAFLRPASPYREFHQSLDLAALRGRPSFTVERTWGMTNDSEREQSFKVVFEWDLRSRKFVSTKGRKIAIDAPTSWEGRSLPKPPAR